MMIRTVFCFLSMIALCTATFGGIPTRMGFCLNPQVKQNFDRTQFFTGRWFKQKGFGSLFSDLLGICPTVEYEITIDKGVIRSLDYVFNQPMQTYLTQVGSCELLQSQENIGYFHFSYTFQGLFSGNFPLYIIDTDYNDWAITYYCKQKFLFFKQEAAWIMSRNRNGTITNEITIMNAIKSSGLKYNNFVPAINSGCGLEEPSL